MPVRGVVQRIAGESAGQVLPPFGAATQDGSRTAAARSGLPARRDLQTACQPSRVYHRVLYFFHGALAAVVSHGLVKEQAVPPKEIDRAIERKKRFEASPQRHTYEEA